MRLRPHRWWSGWMSVAWMVHASYALAAEPAQHGPTLHWYHYLGRLINFTLLVLFLYYLFFRVLRLQDLFRRQRDDLEREIKEAQQRHAEAEARWAQVQEQMRRLEQDLEAMRVQAREEAEREQQRIFHEAQAEVQRLKQMAREEIQRSARFAEIQVRSYAADLATRFGEALLQRLITGQDHRSLIERSLKSFTDHRKPPGE